MKHDDKCEWQNGLMTHACACASRAAASEGMGCDQGETKVVAAVPTGWAQPADGRCLTCDYYDRSRSHCQKHSGLTTPDHTCEDYNFALLNRQECSAAGLMAEPNIRHEPDGEKAAPKAL